VLERAACLLRTLEGAQRRAGDRLREVARPHLDRLYELTVTFPPAAQSFVLHALAELDRNPEVVTFYERFVAETADPELRDEAESHLAAVKG